MNKFLVSYFRDQLKDSWEEQACVALGIVFIKTGRKKTTQKLLVSRRVDTVRNADDHESKTFGKLLITS